MQGMTDTASLTAKITFRVEPEVAAQVDQMAAHAGLGQGALMRVALGLAHTTMALHDLRREGIGPDDPRMVDAKHTMACLVDALKPKRLPSLPNLN